MKILVVHRSYRLRGGEDVFLDQTFLPALKQQGIPFDVLILPPLKPSLGDFLELTFMVLGWERLRPSYGLVSRKMASGNYSHLVLNNFIPTVSLALPKRARALGLKTLWWIHNARIYCANGLVFNGKKECHSCLTESTFECFRQNCHQNKKQSFFYSLVYRGQRPFRKVAPYIDMFLPVSEYAASHVFKIFKVLGGPTPRLQTVFPLTEKNEAVSLPSLSLPRPFFLFMGRVSFEKGADLFADLSQKNPQKVFIMAGDGPLLEAIRSRHIPNLILLGQVSGPHKEWLLKHAQALVITSRVPENAPTVIFESEPYKTPVIYPEGGGAEELVMKLGRPGRPLKDQALDGFEQQGQASTIPDFRTSVSGVFAEV